ncbi:hypothetical protein SAMN04489761_4328 [Tenacibaculum sp. MAR_2009_124]|uniref:hypothetical protein n=1 Tax=Tenacibaculum sp. MAR_2009_124 TaxID=1250059 RepID=UPI00089BBDB5|nr:hypothetical protein [Tenacibaculum sp. MAR_2009_124]SED11825.1 hypothetical protein SAMN04489761_4328 [Tenacibaculum sp. MAR_2009_124]
MSYDKMMKHTRALIKNKRKGRNQYLGFDSSSGYKKPQAIYTVDPKNDFEKWFLKKYGEKHFLHERKDNHQTKTNIKYSVIEFNNEKYMIGHFSKGYTPYNKLTN